MAHGERVLKLTRPGGAALRLEKTQSEHNGGLTSIQNGVDLRRAPRGSTFDKGKQRICQLGFARRHGAPGRRVERGRGRREDTHDLTWARGDGGKVPVWGGPYARIENETLQRREQ